MPLFSLALMGDIVMNKDSNNNFTDALAMNVRYAVLTKNGRIQILVKPTAKGLRKRGQKGWHLFHTIDSQADAARVLEDSFRRALKEIESGSSSTNGKRKKSLLPKALA
jgi:hypothetical protein